MVFPRDRIEGVKAKRPACPTLAPRFSFFQGVATPHVELLKKSTTKIEDRRSGIEQRYHTYDPGSSILNARFTQSIATSSLLGRGRQLSFLVAGVITAPRARDQFAAALRIDAHLDVAERAVALVVGRVIADDVLRAQVFGDLSGDGRNLADVFRKIGPPARIVGDAREQLLSLFAGDFPKRLFSSASSSMKPTR